MGERPRGSNGTCSTLCQFSVTPSATQIQIGPLWCWFPSGWVCVCSRTLWVSPANSPVRLGVSPAAASTLTGVFSQRFEALFPRARALGCKVCLTPQLFLLVYLLANVGPPSPQSAALLSPPAASFPTLVLQLLPCQGSPPPGCLSLPLLLVWMNVSSLTP